MLQEGHKIVEDQEIAFKIDIDDPIQMNSLAYFKGETRQKLFPKRRHSGASGAHQNQIIESLKANPDPNQCQYLQPLSPPAFVPSVLLLSSFSLPPSDPSLA